MSNMDIQDKPGNVIRRTEEKISPADDNDTIRNLPLSPDDFRSVLQRLNEMGLTWSADVPPLLRPKDPRLLEGDPILEGIAVKELTEIRDKYPNFPDELGQVICHALTGSDVMGSLIGNAEDVARKVQIVRELLIDERPNFSAEFFFKYAIKVPYFVDLDWEVVIKAIERNVKGMPLVPYALLSLVFRQSMAPRWLVGNNMEADERESITVAADAVLIERLITSLTQVKTALTKAAEISRALNETVTNQEEGK